ncbi:MAG: hypothetical protein NTY48_00230 [Candidatus Diapherotrites archaeon]|nr:hypothetical protein [Candidatus Diapherotrites archaeon]
MSQSPLKIIQKTNPELFALRQKLREKDTKILELEDILRKLLFAQKDNDAIRLPTKQLHEETGLAKTTIQLYAKLLIAQMRKEGIRINGTLHKGGDTNNVKKIAIN